MTAAPIVKTTDPTKTATLRPSFSVIVLAMAADRIQPTRVADTMISCCRGLPFRSRSSLMSSMAPEMTPVSYPNRKPPMADMHVMYALRVCGGPPVAECVHATTM